MDLSPAFSPELIVEITGKSFDRRNAELIEDVTPQWHIVDTHPCRERKVLQELAARRFGVYLPEAAETVVIRGRKVDRKTILFPGYVFVFVWDALRHRARIEAIDGVQRLMLDVNGIPLSLTDRQIDQIRYLENCKQPIALDAPKRRHRHRKRDEIINVRAWSAFDDAIKVLDLPSANKALRNLTGVSW